MARLPKDPRDHYIATGISIAKLADIYKGQKGCSKTQLLRRSSQENWTALRDQNGIKTVSKTVEKIAERQSTQIADRIAQVAAEDDELFSFLLQVCKGKANEYVVVDPETGRKKVKVNEQQLQKLITAAATASKLRRIALGVDKDEKEQTQQNGTLPQLIDAIKRSRQQ